MPDWARRLLAGERPARDTDDDHALFGWLFLGDLVPGLPDPMSAEGYALWVDHADQARHARAGPDRDQRPSHLGMADWRLARVERRAEHGAVSGIAVRRPRGGAARLGEAGEARKLRTRSWPRAWALRQELIKLAGRPGKFDRHGRPLRLTGVEL